MNKAFPCQLQNVCLTSFGHYSFSTQSEYPCNQPVGPSRQATSSSSSDCVQIGRNDWNVSRAQLSTRHALSSGTMLVNGDARYPRGFFQQHRAGFADSHSTLPIIRGPNEFTRWVPTPLFTTEDDFHVKCRIFREHVLLSSENKQLSSDSAISNMARNSIVNAELYYRRG